MKSVTGIYATRYEFGVQYVRIALCPEFISCIGNKPAYWYLFRTMTGIIKNSRFASFKDVGFDAIYWNGEDWAMSTPKQFGTPEAAYQEWLDKASKVEVG